ncbi:MAG: replication-associated recombination protein A [Flavobacteriales bacterium]|jgi:putative ATPase|nr:replication-associated recombination protein A [Flavobacteriales bacterium]MBT3963624.1 replication-associated recombination protein A [Flavobacteriales bacterium]MBT4705720.1 replication-associated recombination protein A [Flavobacteriales bacterium]MBT5132665.1 replication-associated recombination protein A [Flavobacteriales bacterium]MBT5977532.1 replication-associated recombination protein A [Flavobacteriales bacterium]
MADLNIPLAERLRPKKLDDYIGQDEIVGTEGPIRLAIKAGSLPSMILWGPPGVGKTTLAQILADELERPMYSLSAINSGVKEVRSVIEQASRKDLLSQDKPILFIDEIHRFSKSQQDSLLGAVEKGTVTLIGATTENPSFEVIPALLSRSQVYVLEAFGVTELQNLLERALEEDDWLKGLKLDLKETKALFQLSGGDGRRMLNTLELVAQTAQSEGKPITDEYVGRVVKTKMARYDKTGEQHFDIISAFIKSIRGSDPNASVYWLARMIEGGEDPLFIARRLVILASEDVGLANPTALVIANNCYQAVHAIGYPECRIPLSQATIYLATSAKSNSAYKAIGAAQKLVRETGDLSVPLSIRNAPTKLMKELGYGDNYKYAHDFQGNFADHEFLPEEVAGKTIYTPAKNQREDVIRTFLQGRWKDKYGY